ncbi:palmitoyltransferase ZDHHC3 isoform X1 [Hydra vulgaris]|uniref:palmitoyltransferase ZDHHC3 isoform X1 n=2 Tax=Hydra vulgaris TaxID=6087 RepID=UPI001F5FB81D|nr:palmitoyltransferase ZDHHC3 isoform X1 [Hydra vulgaris]
MAFFFLKDPCGIICLLITYSSIIYADYVVLAEIVVPQHGDSKTCSISGCLHVVVFNALLFLLFYSHVKAMLTDPGYVPFPEIAVDFSETRRSSRKKNLNDDDWTVCRQCELFRPPRSHHCRVCRRCVRKMDHHCPWINNCVGERNQKYFILFLFYTGLSCLHALILIATSWSDPIPDQNESQKTYHRIRLIALIVICLLFCLFVISVLYDQFYSICYDVTAIEIGTKREGKSTKMKKQLLIETFGTGSYLKWFFPCSSTHLAQDYRIDYNV